MDFQYLFELLCGGMVKGSIYALIALGYTKAEAFAAVAKVAEEDLSCEAYIKKALKNLF